MQLCHQGGLLFHFGLKAHPFPICVLCFLFLVVTLLVKILSFSLLLHLSLFLFSPFFCIIQHSERRHNRTPKTVK